MYNVVFQSISCHYANSRCDYIDVHGTNQQPMEDEVREVVKRRLGSDADEAILHIKLKVSTSMCTVNHRYHKCVFTNEPGRPNS